MERNNCVSVVRVYRTPVWAPGCTRERSDNDVAQRGNLRDRFASGGALGEQEFEEGNVDEPADFEGQERFDGELCGWNVHTGEVMQEVWDSGVEKKEVAKLRSAFEELENELMKRGAIHWVLGTELVPTRFCRA